MAVVLALDLVLEHTPGFGQLPGNNKDLAAADGLAQFGAKGNFLPNREFVRRHR